MKHITSITRYLHHISQVGWSIAFIGALFTHNTAIIIVSILFLGLSLIRKGKLMERYMSFTEIAQYLGITSGALNGLKLPEPDAMTGRTRGWKKETIEEWNKNRPGRGNWGNRK